ncbi:hypothetical protein, partial [Salmonella enterica]|uniref:hypothetical protein n=1 Tax=Salmonella enterica TaxID=28901 RepID=UPI00398C652A
TRGVNCPNQSCDLPQSLRTAAECHAGTITDRSRNRHEENMEHRSAAVRALLRDPEEKATQLFIMKKVTKLSRTDLVLYGLVFMVPSGPVFL